MAWQDDLNAVLNSPLFALGTGMLAAAGPRVGAPVGFGQALDAGLQNYQQQAQTQQAMAMKQQQLQQQAASQALLDRYRQAQIANANAPAPVTYTRMQQLYHGLPTYLGSNGQAYVVGPTGQLAPVRAPAPAPKTMAQPTGALPPGLPTKTQNYVTKVRAALGSSAPTNPDGTASAAFIHAIQQVESGGNPNAVSPAGAEGVMQLMPRTAKAMGVADPFNPQQNIAGGTKYYNQLLQKYGNPMLAAAAYNAGPGRVDAALNATHTANAAQTTAQAPPDSPAAWTLAPSPGANAIHLGQDEMWANSEHTAVMPIPGSAAAEKQNPVAQRTQQIPAIEKSLGRPLDPIIKQAYIQTGQMPSLSRAALDNAAWQELFTGRQERYYGGPGSASMAAIQNDKAEITQAYHITPGDMQTAQGRRKALGSSLDNIQKQSDMLDRNIATFHDNTQVLLGAAQKVNNGLSYDWNRIKNAVQARTGNTDVTNMWAAKQSVANEYAKIMSMQTTGGGTSDTARDHAEQLLSTALSYPQLQGVIQTLDKDAQNQHKENAQREYVVEQLMGTYGTTGVNAPVAGSPLGAQAPSPLARPDPSIPQPTASNNAPPAAVMYLKAHPKTRAQFDEMYGAGAAEQALDH